MLTEVRPRALPATHEQPDPVDYCDGDFYACEYPERPTSRSTLFDPGCRACVMALGATAVNQPEEREWAAGWYVLFRHEHDLPPLPCA